MALINFPTATANGQEFEGPNGVIYTYIGTPPNGYWSGNTQDGLSGLDSRFLKLDASNSPITGNLGIGTSTPSRDIHIKAAAPGIRLEDTDWGGYHDITENANGDLLFGSNASSVAGVDSNIRFQISSDEKVRIDSDGNVGIGTPGADMKLVVSEPISSSTGARMKFENTGERGVTLGFIGHDPGPLWGISNGSQTLNFLTIDAGGNVGIGVDDAADKLEVDGNIAVTGTVDGRDVAADGSKLDSIESGATGDLTAAEILTLLKTVDGSGSGLDADLLDGLSTSTAGTGSTICSRNASGDSNFRYVYSAYLNMNHGAADRNSDTVFYSSNDDFVRKNTATGFRTALDVPTRTGGDASGTWGINITGSAGSVDGINSSSFLRSDAADLATQKIVFGANDTNNWDTIATTTGSLGCIELKNSGSGNDSFMALHTGSDFGCYFGLDAGINDIAVGGWSMGANSYRVWHQGNDGAGSGLDADLLDGAQPSMSASNSTIVQRNGSGHVYANYFNTSPNDVTSGVTKVCVETGNDGFIRHGSAAAIRSFINVADGATNYDGSDAVKTTNNTGLNSDTRNTRGVTRLYRREDNSDFSVQTYWTGARWKLEGYQGDNFHAQCHVGYADNAGTLDGVDSSQFLRSDANDTATGTVTFNGVVNIRSAIDLADNDILRFGSGDDIQMFYNGSDFYIDMQAASDNIYIRNSSDSVVWRCSSAGEVRYAGDVVPDTDNTGNVGTSALTWANGQFTNLTINSTLNVRGAIDLADNDIVRFGSGDDAEFFCNGSHFYLDLNSGIGNFYIRDGSTTRFTFDDAGSFTATGDITAFSDINLKDNIEVIPDALNKVSQLRGVTYERNDMDGERQSGVIAQEVEAVLPEVVRTNEDGIKSVAYGNLVGLLIESIKELKAEIEELKAERN